MPREFPRSRRIEEQIQRVLSDVLRTRVRDPRLQKVIVTDVSVSRDLSVARVYFTTLDMDETGDTLAQAVHAAAGFMRRELARELTVRNVPELRFRFDDSMRKGLAMEELIDEVIEQDQRARNGDENHD